MHLLRLSRSSGVLIVLIGGILFALAFDHIAYSHTKSVNYRFFVKRALRQDDVVKRGDYLSFDNLVPEGRVVRELKQVACLPGDYLKVEGEGMPSYFCNKVFMGIAKTTTPSGKALSPFNYDGVIPQGQFFMFGSHVNSFDSRYYGFITKDRFKDKLWPVF